MDQLIAAFDTETTGLPLFRDPSDDPRQPHLVDICILAYGADGKPFTKTQQVHMCGNSVSPPPMAALARANDPWRAAELQVKAA